MSADGERAERFFASCERTEQTGTARLADDELLSLLAEQRWAIARLSSVRTPLRERSVLNAASLKAHALLHGRRRSSVALGTALTRVRGAFGLASFVFVAATTLAFVAVRGDPTLAYAIVPRELLAQSWGERAGLSEGIAMMFFYWGNNLRASFMCLSLGALAGVTAFVPLVFNAAMLGAVAAASERRGALPALLEWIAPHGVPELTALILCSAIGLELGRSWLHPGSQTRRRSAALAGRELGPMLLVATVLVLLAAPLEGFVAPLALPVWLDVAIPVTWLAVLGGGSYVLAIRGNAKLPR